MTESDSPRSDADNFTQHLDTVREKLPVLSGEVGDTWAYGVPSDPQKASRIRCVDFTLVCVHSNQETPAKKGSFAPHTSRPRFSLSGGKCFWTL